MSISLALPTLTLQQREEIQKLRLDLTSKFSTYVRSIYPYRMLYESNQVSVPFYWAQEVLGARRRKKKECAPLSSTTFVRELRPEQLQLRTEAIAQLNGKTDQAKASGTCLISAYCGFGKCLGYGTPVLLYDGSIRQVQQITPGDVLLGDDGKPRNVLRVDRGRARMYRIRPVYSVDMPEHLSGAYTANADHILCLHSIATSQVVEISIRNYLQLKPHDKHDLYGYRAAPLNVPYRRPSKFGNCHAYLLGWNLGRRSRPRQDRTPLHHFAHFGSWKECLALLAGLIDANGRFNSTIRRYEVWVHEFHKKYIFFLCRSIGVGVQLGPGEILWLDPVFVPCLNQKITWERRKYLASTSNRLYAFTVEPLGEADYYGFLIDKNHRFLLGDFSVTHNTCVAIHLACVIGLRTLIIANKLVLLKQWMDSLEFFAPQSTRYQLLPAEIAKREFPTDSDFYVVNAENVPKFAHSGIFSNIGLVIVDEAHLIMAETLSTSLQYLHPAFLIGLSATPYREDGLGLLLDLYFGPSRIVRKLERKHTVWVVRTGFQPEVELTAKGKLNWGVLLDSLSALHPRNLYIVQLLSEFSQRTFLVLVKRVAQGKQLEALLQARGESVTSLLGTNQSFDPEARILIGTASKIGVGFDHPRLDALLLAADVEQYFIQYLGRVFRTQSVEPIVLDILDDHPILLRHFQTRVSVYKAAGGRIRNYKPKEFSEPEALSLLKNKENQRKPK